ncbi:MATE family efflux transporter [Pseudactinotalea sp. HY160]|uniref:MATE family efflux transporter n=1 Tax=Pseudactinotalea sp. HY160 TaxID=2654490 RepID=UPI00351B5893
MDDTPARHADEVSAEPGPVGRAVDRRIFALAWPALGALVAEPVFVLIDSAVVGHLGTAQLAGLSLASTLLVTVVAVCVFLAYATTAAVARKQGAGDLAAGVSLGVDGMWLALGLGLVLTAVGLAFAPGLVTALGASDEIVPHAVAYLRWSVPGITGMLLVLAATGTLRGLQDTRTPFHAAVTGAIVNAAGSVALVYGAGMGIAGSGLATAATQLGMGAWLVYKVFTRARDLPGVRLAPHPAAILASARAGLPLFVRTVTLRGAMIVTVLVATRLGDVPLAAHQIVLSIWGLTAFALDALAIAAQALIGASLGAGDAGIVRRLTSRALRWGVLAGIGIGALVAGSGWLITPLFTADPAVQAEAAWALLVCGVAMPIAGWVFVLDGVLIGAGDGRFLAWAGVVTLVAYLPFAALVWWALPTGPGALAWLWAAFAGAFMIARALTTGVRARGTNWMVLGA